MSLILEWRICGGDGCEDDGSGDMVVGLVGQSFRWRLCCPMRVFFALILGINGMSLILEWRICGGDGCEDDGSGDMVVGLVGESFGWRLCCPLEGIFFAMILGINGMSLILEWMIVVKMWL
ncbi:hypothetical protein [Persicobacter diffluens]|uniref:Transmembrane protein n=1 Tax=Persicobacter diffluens TaxID=981 RepID=A0AAN5AN44_9BACT|nr:hypothetical protein PEDI_30400 [Persicobacter diffluens]